jgi:hypothetical protein
MKKIKQSFRGKEYEIIFTNNIPKTKVADCDIPSKENPIIRIKSSLKNKKKLEILIHEMLHANFWDLDEKAVHERARDMAKALWKLNYKD